MDRKRNKERYLKNQYSIMRPKKLQHKFQVKQEKYQNTIYILKNHDSRGILEKYKKHIQGRK